VDDRGYNNVLSFLFPSVGDVSWRSPAYPAVAASAGTQGANEGPRPPVRPYAWEPVLRHVSVALCALEQAAKGDGNPQLHLDAVDRITNSWLRVLKHLVGQGPADDKLPRQLR
jgi:hypothetical protein